MAIYFKSIYHFIIIFSKHNNIYLNTMKTSLELCVRYMYGYQHQRSSDIMIWTFNHEQINLKLIFFHSVFFLWVCQINSHINLYFNSE